MIQTLASNIPGLTGMKFLIASKGQDPLQDADLSQFYEVSQVNKLAKQLFAVELQEATIRCELSPICRKCSDIGSVWIVG